MAALSLTITTQVLGYGWAGLLRKYLVVYTYALSPSHTHKSSLLHHFFSTLNLCFFFPLNCPQKYGEEGNDTNYKNTLIIIECGTDKSYNLIQSLGSRQNAFHK
jgi:hypothetical protein